jgi:hypothetical protein
MTDAPNRSPASGALVVLAVLGLAAVALSRYVLPGGHVEHGPALTRPTTLPAARPAPAAGQFTLVSSIRTEMDQIRGIAVGPFDHVYVVGDSIVRVFDNDRYSFLEWATSGPGVAIAVGKSGHAYVALRQKIEKYDERGLLLKVWGTPGKGPGQLDHVTGIAVHEPDVYVADAGNRVIHRFAMDGDFIQDIGAKDEAAGIPGIICPSPYLDCDVDTAGLLRVANPGRWRIETYTGDGRLLSFWGRQGMGPENFAGCCNPTNLAVAPDGRIVTSEKGEFPQSAERGPAVGPSGQEGAKITRLARVKVCDAQGRLIALLGEDLWEEGAAACDPGPAGAGGAPTKPALPCLNGAAGLDVAFGPSGNIYVAHPTKHVVRVFARSKMDQP